MSSFNRPPRPFQFPAYDPQADDAYAAAPAGRGAAFGAAVDGFAPAPARSQAQPAARHDAQPLPDIYAPRGPYAHRDTYAPQDVYAPRNAYAPYEPAPLDPHAPTHSWLDLELIPSWLRPFTIDANTRFTRTPDLYLRPREAEAQAGVQDVEAVLASPLVAETAPPPDISSRSWHFVLDPADDEPAAAPHVSAWSEPVPDAAGTPSPEPVAAEAAAFAEQLAEGAHMSASGGEALAVTRPDTLPEARAPSVPAWEGLSAPWDAGAAPDEAAAVPDEGGAPWTAAGLPAEAPAAPDWPADVPPVPDSPAAAGWINPLPPAESPAADAVFGPEAEGCASSAEALFGGAPFEHTSFEQVPLEHASFAPASFEQTSFEHMSFENTTFENTTFEPAPEAPAADIETAAAADAQLMPHLQALTRMLVIGHAAAPPVPAHDQDLAPLSPPAGLAADGPAPSSEHPAPADAVLWAGAAEEGRPASPVTGAGFDALPAMDLPAVPAATSEGFDPGPEQAGAGAPAGEMGAAWSVPDRADLPLDDAAMLQATVDDAAAVPAYEALDAALPFAAGDDLAGLPQPDGAALSVAPDVDDMGGPFADLPAAAPVSADAGVTDLPPDLAGTVPAMDAGMQDVPAAETFGFDAQAPFAAPPFTPEEGTGDLSAPDLAPFPDAPGANDAAQMDAAQMDAAQVDAPFAALPFAAEDDLAAMAPADGFAAASAPEEALFVADALAPAAMGGDGLAEAPAPALPLAGTGGIGALWSPYQQLVTAHFLGGVAAFAPAVAEPVPAPAATSAAATNAAAPTPAPAAAAPAAVPDLPDREMGPAYDLPPLDLLREPPVVEPDYELSEEFLDQSSTMLQQVLRDFGVRGEVIDANPGPVVTLYEFEPAPGVKSSRVIGLSPDIARSMSAISARVAVVEGRNVIGIELPNRRRETVWLRELLASHEFAEARPKLGLCLGKTIGGAPVIADLARMPHLLVAGTTGSGKSVAINTMILSLLYRHTPEACRLIMIDPKMLELSIYEGIPHLLTPVVTDPKKAIIALKWAVKEMEERYKKMSRLAVRNIDGYNARVKEAAEKGEIITRNVQVGFDKETGEALFEEQEMDLTALPYIVVIVDEMADLMMVAGKEIEGAIQRLAQMARAAGIHLVMATQRPSVDVITGTIKANFPTRISFQVTSKIDSRTILGEMGAETLLGQGDMLFMAGGGRITRVHGPFVSDAEVEHVVAHLKAQGGPDYLDAVVLDEEAEADDEDEAVFDRSGLGEAGGDLYEQAVAIVMRDRKASTSYIQRRLQVGYNKAASLMERMETEGIVGPANHAGKREILTFSRPG